MSEDRRLRRKDFPAGGPDLVSRSDGPLLRKLRTAACSPDGSQYDFRRVVAVRKLRTTHARTYQSLTKTFSSTWDLLTSRVWETPRESISRSKGCPPIPTPPSPPSRGDRGMLFGPAFYITVASHVDMCSYTDTSFIEGAKAVNCADPRLGDARRLKSSGCVGTLAMMIRMRGSLCSCMLYCRIRNASAWACKTTVHAEPYRAAQVLPGSNITLRLAIVQQDRPVLSCRSQSVLVRVREFVVADETIWVKRKSQLPWQDGPTPLAQQRPRQLLR